MDQPKRLLLFGNEAVARAALDAGVALGTGYPGTPSTEILEVFSALGGRAQWSPNEKVALEVGLGAAFGGGRALVTMKHVGVNVAADPLFTAAYTGVTGGLVVVSADDPGMHSSQNEQDNRYYAKAAGIPMLEPADSQEAYEFTLVAFELSEQWHIPVMLRMTTRVCHSKSIVCVGRPVAPPAPPIFRRDIRGRVMVPAFAKPAHRRLREKLEGLAAWNEEGALTRTVRGGKALGIITSGVSHVHVREACPDASVLKLGMTHPLPLAAMRAFAESVDRCVAVEEGEAYLAESARAAGIPVEAKDGVFRFGELNVDRVRRIMAGDLSPEPQVPAGQAPRLCSDCSHRAVFQALAQLGCTVAGDIGCYTLSALPPYEAMDTCVCMGASIGVGLGLRHVLRRDQARKVVSVIGDSTFVHSGIPGIVEMVYNPPPTGHVVLILDNGTTAMTGAQEHPGTGRALDGRPSTQLVYEDLCRALGVPNVHVVDPKAGVSAFRELVEGCLEREELTVIIARSPCAIMLKRRQAAERQVKAAHG